MCSTSWQFYEVAFYMAFTAIKAVSDIYGHEQRVITRTCEYFPQTVKLSRLKSSMDFLYHPVLIKSTFISTDKCGINFKFYEKIRDTIYMTMIKVAITIKMNNFNFVRSSLVIIQGSYN